MKRFRLSVFWLVLGASTLTTSHGQDTKVFRSAAGAEVHYEEFGDPKSPNCLILLHGASGLSLPLYRDQSVFFGAHGFHVLTPHYFDATHSSTPTVEHYRTWASLTTDLISQCRQESATQAVFLVGYSLGSSVALAAGSQGAPVDAIADFYGSLPDEFFYEMKGMPPLLILHGERDSNIPIMNAQQLVKLCEMKHLQCDHHFYPDQDHGFTGKILEDADQRTLAFFAQDLHSGLSQ